MTDHDPMPSFTVRVRSSDAGSSTVEAAGEIDLASSPELRRVLQGVLDDGARHVVLDFHEVTFIDSSGLGVLVGALKRLNEGGDDGTLEVRGMTAPVRKVFEITGLTEIFAISE